jgi:class 3 adenylate cyclase/HAMP domain-containing protein
MAVAVVVLTITAFLSVNYADQILKERTGNQLISESTVRGDSIRILYDTRIKQTQILATDPMIQILVSTLNDIHGNPEFNSILNEKQRNFLIQVQAFQELVGFSIGLEDLQIIGKDGIVFFSLGRISNNDFSQDPLFLRGLKEDFVDFEKISSGRKMVIVTTIFERDNKIPSDAIGVVIATMRTAAIDEILLNRSGLGETGEVYMVNENQLLISESRFLENASFNQHIATLPVTKCFDDESEVVGFYPDYRGTPIYGSSYCAKDLGFVLLAEIDEAETIQSIRILQDRIFETGLGITVAMVAVAFFLSKRISRPLLKLKNAANEIAKGNFEVRTNIKTGDEIEDLSITFDSMAKKLQESIIAIKQREEIIKQQKDILLQFSNFSEKYCVCMVDVINSTKITANMSDTETSEFYRIFLNSTASIVRKFGGVVVKNIGDALLFYFPQTPSQDKSIFKNVIDCCLSLGESHEEINDKMFQAKLPFVDYKTSATYGLVRIAKIATSSVDDIFGAAVNRCAKINISAPPNGLIIGEELYENIKDLEEYTFHKISTGLVLEEYGFTGYTVTRRIKEEKHYEILGGN